MKNLLLIIIVCCNCLAIKCFAQNASSSFEKLDKAIIFNSPQGNKLRVTAYGNNILRLQSAKAQQDFLPDNHYEMVESHQWLNNITIKSIDQHWQLSPEQNPHLKLLISKKTLQATFLQHGSQTLAEVKFPSKKGNVLKAEFINDPKEHFSGLGHSFYGREPSLDLKGQRTSRNYGKTPIEQAPLIVPFYLSSKGYGVFVNSTFANEFSFGDKNEYSIALDDHGFSAQMDYFYIAGATLPQVLNNYTQLTGRPRLPHKARFGLQLSVKAHDHN
jgi:alpha-D-xyloside xylohydrolase